MSLAAFDDAWLQRIGYDGPHGPRAAIAYASIEVVLDC
jgi:hypothetical protein